MKRLIKALRAGLIGLVLFATGALVGLLLSRENSFVSKGLPDGVPGLRALLPEQTGAQQSLLEAGQFGFYAPGNLLPRTGSGTQRGGIEDWTRYAPDMIFPVKESAPSYLNSQIYNPGGGRYVGLNSNNQCAPENYSYPWRDNFCEGRSGTNRESLNCPSRAIHQGVDIRGGSGGAQGSACYRMAWGGQKGLVPVVAAEAGRIEYSRLPYKYVVMLITDEGRIFRYLHLEQESLKMNPGQRVAAGETIGYLSNYFGRTRTTHHLHFEISENVAGRGFTQVSPYMSLVRAYERDQGLEAVLVE